MGEVIVGESGPTTHGWHQCSSFLECPKRYQFDSIRGIQQAGQVLTRTPLAVGALVHGMRACWLASQCQAEWQTVYRAGQAEAFKQRLPVSPDDERLAVRLMQEYIEHYNVLPYPQTIAAELLVGPTELFPGEPTSVRTARLDDVSYYPEAGGQLCIGELKTTAFMADCGRQYALHGQPMLQVALWRLSGNAERYGDVAGVMLDVVEKPGGRNRNKTRFSRQLLTITKHQLDWFLQSMRGYLRAMALVDWNTTVPRNPTACSWCQYKALCQYGKAGATDFVFRDGTRVTRWAPEPGKETEPWI